MAQSLIQCYRTILASGKPWHLNAKALLMMPDSRTLMTVTVTVAAICILFLIDKTAATQCLVKSCMHWDAHAI